MRRAILLGAILAVVPGLAGAQRITVHELEQILASSAGPPPAADSEMEVRADLLDQIDRENNIALRLGGLELSERLTTMEKAELTTKYRLGTVARSALDLVADRSAFLDPPPAEIPDLPPPDAEAQHTMVRQAGEFVFNTLAHLPNFFALLSTTQYDDGPLVAGGELLAAAPGMHPVGTSEREITFSDGREVFDSSRGNLRPSGRRDAGLDSQGEFGAEAATVMLDLRDGALEFQHWERTGIGNVAVFRYTVPAGHAHYEVKAGCRGKVSFRAQPAYHGTISIEPKSGVLVRFTLQTEAGSGDPIKQVSSVIEYGPVTLGDRHYLCPIRSLAFSVQEADSCRESHHRALPRPVAMLNRIVFSDYHRLGSEMTIVPGEPQPGKPDQPHEGPEKPGPAQEPAAHPPAGAPAATKIPKK
jgi:hypothetical protein